MSNKLDTGDGGSPSGVLSVVLENHKTMEFQETLLGQYHCLVPSPAKGELHFLEFILPGCACKGNSSSFLWQTCAGGGIFSLGAAPGQAEAPSRVLHPCADVAVSTSAQPVCAQSCN